jgi:hypothetical protein
MALVETLATREALPDLKEAEIEVDIDKEVKLVIKVGIRLKDKSNNFIIIIKYY